MGRGQEVRKTDGNSRDDSSPKNTRMRSYDEQYSTKSRTGHVLTLNKERREKVKKTI